MAVKGTQLYNKSKEKIFPITDASVVDCGASGKSSTVHEDIAELYSKISEITGDQEAASNIIINIAYKRSRSNYRGDIIDDSGWGVSFINPTSDYPYTWKRTEITYRGATTSNTTYEIVASANAEITESIYIALPNGQEPIIYPEDDYGNINYTLYDDGSIPNLWSRVPQSISASAPNAFISTRVKKDGKWGQFSPPAQYGRWAYDSNIVIKYQVTSTSEVPTLNAEEVLPGENWVDSNTKLFKGFLWMITATAVNGQLQKYNNVIWNGPNLMSAIL